jgi:quinol monooxygenase YgiN
LTAGLLLLACATHDALAQAVARGPVFLVTYIEAMHASRDAATVLLRQEGGLSRAAEGNLRYEVLQRRGRPNQLAIIEAWRDQAAADANLASGHMKQFREKLASLLSGGFDQRPHGTMNAGPVEAGADAGSAAVYALTHVDLIGPKKDEGMVLLDRLADPSRRDAGNLRYEVLQQNSRLNHFTVVEIWKNQAALESHEMAARTRAFRDALLPMSGSLFDQRLYRVLR